MSSHPPNHTDPTQSKSPSKVAPQVITIVLLTRLILSSVIQIFFPFLPLIASGLNQSEVELARYLGLSKIANLVSPFFGIVADKRGYRRVILFGLLITAIGTLLIYFSQTPGTFVLGLFLMGGGSAGVSPTLVAYMSHLLPFESRSRGLGMLEYTYAFTGIAVMPIFGWLIGWTSWRMPFLVMGLLELLLIIGFFQMPGTGREADESAVSTRDLFNDILDFGPNWRSAIAVLFSDSLTKMAGMVLNINFGTWLAYEYGLEAAQLGQVAFLMGIADICGSGLVSIFGDRIGKQRSVLVATGFGVLFYLLLPLWNQGYVMALLGLLMARWTLEFSIVAHIVLISEQSPEHRGKMMTMRMGLGFLAMTVGAFVGPLLYKHFGVWGIGIPGAASMLGAWTVTRFLTLERG
ncbi:MAG: MFS transporter [Chloroflexota bacterium]